MDGPLKFARLDANRQKLALGAFGWLIIARAWLAVGSLAGFQRWIAGPHRSAGDKRLTMDEASWAVCAVARRFAWCTCLVRSLALLAMLRGSGKSVELRIGVGRDASGAFIAHAWVVCDGQPVPSDGQIGRYAQLPLPTR
jgi:hypothetical protein